MLYHYMKRILEYNPTHIGLSLFSTDSQVFTAWLCTLLKKERPDIKIVIGGPGLTTLESRKVSFPLSLKQKKLIDNFIVGDASQSLIEYFVDNKKQTEDRKTAQQDPDFHNAVTPDFDDYNFLMYEYVRLPIVDSRGCVQKCEFCDVIEFWNKFQYLSAEVVFSQMQELIKKYNIYWFDFASSISNGNLVQFRKLIKIIADFNHEKPANKQIHWNGNFIIRPKGRHTDDLYKDIKQSNGHLLCGVESLSSKVRIALGKNFNNDDLDYHLEQCKKHKIKIDLLIIASYLSETDEDYKNALKWFDAHSEYANSIVERVQMTIPGLLAGTKLTAKTDKKDFDAKESKRVEHANQLTKKATECGFQVETFF